MNPKIRGSDVYVTADMERILAALAASAGRYPSTEYRSGYLDALDAVSMAIGAATPAPAPLMERWTETRTERTIERYTTPPADPGRRFAIRGEREQWPAEEQDAALARPAPADMTGDDVSVTLFNPTRGRLVTREIGHAWIGNDGYTAFWSAADWQRVTVEEARSWGQLVPDDYAVIVRHPFADARRRQIGRSADVIDNPPRRQLR